MNVKDSRCMNKIRNILLLCLISCSIPLTARTYEDIARRSFWQDSRNVAGIRLDSLSRSYAEIYGRYEEGGFMATWDAPRGWKAGARTGSVIHLDRMSLTGSFSFDQTEGYGMCGSMFVKPGYFPIDVMEFTPGRKTLQRYAFEGGIAYDLGNSWSIGARMDFESSNLAKRKDLRYTDWRLDMNVAPSIIYRNGGWAFGFSPVFRKVSETIGAQQIGTTESSYYAFLDKGLMFGTYQVWTGSGVHLEEAGVNGLPVREYSYGGALQARYQDIYADLEFMYDYGKAGEKEYIWFEFPGMHMASDVRYIHYGNGREHHFRLHFEWKRQDMDENVLERVSENGITDIVNHGSNRILCRQTWSLSPEYEYVSENLEISSSLGLDRYAGLSSQVYPYINTLSHTDLSAQVKSLVRLGSLDIRAGLRASKGMHEEGSRTAGKNDALTEPFRLQDWHDRQVEYISAFRTGLGLSFRYNFDKGIYIDASGSWIHGYGTVLLDSSNRFGAELRIGYDF